METEVPSAIVTDSNENVQLNTFFNFSPYSTRFESGFEHVEARSLVLFPTTQVPKNRWAILQRTLDYKNRTSSFGTKLQSHDLTHWQRKLETLLVQWQ